MSKKKRFGVSQALSQGLSETIHVVENNSGTFRNAILPLSRIELDPDNPRKLAINLMDVRSGIVKTDPQLTVKQAELERLQELAKTIESTGIINPVVVYKHGELYRVVAGERRCLASILVGRQDIEARVFNDRPRAFDLKLLQWVENTAREDLTLAERIGNLEEIVTEYQAANAQQSQTLTATLLKNITGLSLSQASYYVAVMNAPQDVLAAIQAGQLKNLDKAATLAAITDPEIRSQAIAACSEGASLKELKRLANQATTVKQISSAVALTTKKRGRTTTRINMGFTHDLQVIKTIIDSVLARHEYQHLATLFSGLDWQHYSQVNRAFRRLIEVLETEAVYG